MKTSLAIGAFLTLSACISATRAHHASAVPVPDDDPLPYPPLTADAPMQRLLDTLDDTLQTDARLDRTDVATTLDAIADAMQSFTRHDREATEALRTNVSALRKPLKARRQSKLVRDALDNALVELRAHASAHTFDDIERASSRIEGVSPTEPLARQTMALRNALCAVGNAISARARLNSLRCINASEAIANNPPSQSTAR